MTISMYNASLPVFKQPLSALNAILIKARGATNNEIQPETLLQACLFPDMFDFTRIIYVFILFVLNTIQMFNFDSLSDVLPQANKN